MKQTRPKLDPSLDPRCVAYVPDRPHYLHSYRCRNMAYTVVGGYKVCGTHARLARRWDGEKRLDLMVEHYWKSK